jgi:Pathogenicity locus
MAKVLKARVAADCKSLEALPNIGRSLAADLRLVGIQHPGDLVGADGFGLYQALCRVTGRVQDPCVLDTFLAVVDFMGGAPAAPWWHYTQGRKARFGSLPGVFGPGAVTAAGSSSRMPADPPCPKPAGIGVLPTAARSPGSATTECPTARSSA